VGGACDVRRRSIRPALGCLTLLRHSTSHWRAWASRPLAVARLAHDLHALEAVKKTAGLRADERVVVGQEGLGSAS
jgi:hypothetical protein